MLVLEAERAAALQRREEDQAAGKTNEGIAFVERHAGLYTLVVVGCRAWLKTQAAALV